jgi:hypothetical protein
VEGGRWKVEGGRLILNQIKRSIKSTAQSNAQSNQLLNQLLTQPTPPPAATCRLLQLDDTKK